MLIELKKGEKEKPSRDYPFFSVLIWGVFTLMFLFTNLMVVCKGLSSTSIKHVYDSHRVKGVLGSGGFNLPSSDSPSPFQQGMGGVTVVRVRLTLYGPEVPPDGDRT